MTEADSAAVADIDPTSDGGADTRSASETVANARPASSDAAFREQPTGNGTANGQPAAETITVLNVSRDPQKRQAFIVDRRKNVVQKLAQFSKNVTEDKPLDLSSVQIRGLVEKTELFLTWLEVELQITPSIKNGTQLDQCLKLMFNDTRFHFPENLKDRAQALHERWEEENWGANDVVEDEGADGSDDNDGGGTPEAKRRRTSIGRSGTGADFDGVATMRLPPPNHRIWGVDGIMHGIAIKQGKRRNYQLDPRYALRKKNPKIFGDNGFKNGAWFPFQIVALFRGAHGSPMAGIAGNREEGAYSIVVSGMYEDLDQDHGDTLYYSGSGSHENTDPRNPAASTGGTQALQESQRSGRPVRVLRSANGKSKWAPIVGLRYDGLYTVTELHHPRNLKGGMYEQFKLERQPGQPPIAKGKSPTAAEIRQYDEIQRGY